jgi:hypothetical protein
MFDTDGLMPGQTVSAHFSVPSEHHALKPMLQAKHLHDGCVHDTSCRPEAHLLSRVLEIVVTAPDGQTLRTTPAALVSATSLPGGVIPADSGSRHYSATLTLPASISNPYENRTTSFDFEYGDLGKGTGVLGEKVGRGSGKGGSKGQTSAGSGLPFTGADILVELAAALSLIAGGASLTIGGLRRWRSSEQ